MTNVGVPTLGHYDNVTAQFADIGGEHTIQDTISYMGMELVQTNSPVLVRWVVNGSNATLQPGTVCTEMAATHHMREAVAGEAADGIVDPRVKKGIPAGAKFLMVFKGPIEIKVGATVNDGEFCSVGALGIAGTSGLVAGSDTFGEYLEDGVAGSFTRARVNFENVGSGGAASPVTITDVAANVANVAARDAHAIPAGQQDYDIKVATNGLLYRTVDAGATWAPVSYQTTVATLAARNALTEVETGQRVFVDAENSNFRWDGAAWVEVGGAGETTTYDIAVPSAATGNDGDQSVQVGGNLNGMIFEKVTGAWTYTGQDREPILAAEVTSGDAIHTAVVAALPVGGYYQYRVFRNARYEIDTIFQTGTIFRNSISGSGGGITLPANSAGFLTNDGAGNLSWTVSSTAQYTHTQAVAALVWNVAHNLGGTVDSVNIYVGGQKVGAQVDIVDSNNLTITFATAQAGIAIIEL